MISLDEDYIGMDANTIIVRALKVCGGVLCRLGNGNLLGAHYTNGTSALEILTGCTYLRNHYMGGNAVASMYFIARLAAWQQRTDKYANTHTLLAELKTMFNYAGQILVFDKDIIGASVDVRIDNPGFIGYRTTLANDPLVTTANANVHVVRPANGGATPVVQNTAGPIFLHKLPQTQNGFTAFQPGQMVPV
jgi:hypothetical protein